MCPRLVLVRIFPPMTTIYEISASVSGDTLFVSMTISCVRVGGFKSFGTNFQNGTRPSFERRLRYHTNVNQCNYACMHNFLTIQRIQIIYSIGIFFN